MRINIIIINNSSFNNAKLLADKIENLFNYHLEFLFRKTDILDSS